MIRAPSILVLALLALAGSAHAQTDPDGAREAFAEGIEAAADARWERARERFAASYALEPKVAALYNLATALRALGRHREARDALDRVLTDPDAREDVRDSARTMRAEEQARIARLVLALDPAAVRVRIDGRPRRDTGERPLGLEVDPGPRALDVEREGSRPYRWSGRLAPGEERRLEVALQDDAPVRRVVKSPWLWVGVGAVLVTVVTVVVVARAGRDLSPESPEVLRP